MDVAESAVQWIMTLKKDVDLPDFNNSQKSEESEDSAMFDYVVNQLCDKAIEALSKPLETPNEELNQR